MILPSSLLHSFLLVLAFIPIAAQGEEQSKLNWSVTPYIWATKTTYDLTADGSLIDTGVISFDELMDTTDTSFQVAIEAGRALGHWSVMVDITYIETSDDDTFTVPDLGVVRTDSKSEQIYADVAIAYWPWSEAGGMSVLAGIRYTDLDDETKLRLVEPDGGRLGNLTTERDFTDALVGARYIFRLSDRWKLNTRLDYAFGDSEGIFLAEAIVRYSLGENQGHGIMLGYRWKDAEFKDDGLDEDYDYKGPLIGFNFRF
jgi:hypothetical protein